MISRRGRIATSAIATSAIATSAIATLAIDNRLGVFLS
jgi:hypothetical protein